METLRNILVFCGDYFTTVFWSWWSLAFLLFAINEMSEWLFKKSLRWLHEKRVFVAFVLILIAQAAAYKDLSDKYAALSDQKAPAVVQVPYRQYDEREWPPLTDDQIAEWVKALAPFQLKTIGVYWGQEVEARRLFRTIQEVGKQLKCIVSAQGGYADKPEITILAGKDNPAGPVIQKLFRHYQKGESVPVTLDAQGDGEGISIFLPECPQRQSAAVETNRSNRSQEIQALARFLNSGQTLEDRFGDETVPTNEELRAWGQSVLGYINSSEALGAGYAARFNHAPIPPGLDAIGLNGRTNEESARWKLQRSRNTALRDFIKELSTP